jgi:hypothetical protein
MEESSVGRAENGRWEGKIITEWDERMRMGESSVQVKTED